MWLVYEVVITDSSGHLYGVYIGQTSCPWRRVLEHENDSSNPEIQSAMSEGCSMVLIQRDWARSQEEAWELERALIAETQAGPDKCLNMNKGVGSD